MFSGSIERPAAKKGLRMINCIFLKVLVNTVFTFGRETFAIFQRPC